MHVERVASGCAVGPRAARQHVARHDRAEAIEQRPGQRLLDGRQRHPRVAMPEQAVVIEGSTNGDVVEPGVLVELQHDGDDDAITYLVGSIEERNDTYSVLSTESPLGQALLGAAPGTKVKYQGPKRELGVTVVAVRPLG